MGMQSPLWMKDYHILLNGIESLQNDINMLRRNLLNEGEIGADASFKPRRLGAAEESIFDGLSNDEREQWIDIMSRINWASLKGRDRRRLEGGGEGESVWYVSWDELPLSQSVVIVSKADDISGKITSKGPEEDKMNKIKVTTPAPRKKHQCFWVHRLAHWIMDGVPCKIYEFDDGKSKRGREIKIKEREGSNVWLVSQRNLQKLLVNKKVIGY